MGVSSKKFTLLIHLNGSYNPSCKICLWKPLNSGGSIKYESIKNVVEFLSGLGFTFNDIFILCPDPFSNNDISNILRLLNRACRSLNLMLGISDLLNLKLNLLEYINNLFIICDSYPKLNMAKQDILAIESHGFENIEIIFPVIPHVNDYDIKKVLNFCRIRGLHLKVLEHPAIEEHIDLINFISSKVKDISISEASGYFIGCYLKRTAFYRDFPFQILTRTFRDNCNTLYVNCNGYISRCPFSEELYELSILKSTEVSELKCPINPRNLILIPKIRISLKTHNGIEIYDDELEILDLIDKRYSIRQIASILNISHTCVRRKLLSLQKRLSLKLIDKDRYTGRVKLSKTGRKIVEYYRFIKRKMKI